MPVEQATIETKYKQAQRTLKYIGATRETARRSGQTRQVMSQFCIACFHRPDISHAFQNCLSVVVIPQTIISIKNIAVVMFGLDVASHPFQLLHFPLTKTHPAIWQYMLSPTVRRCDDGCLDGVQCGRGYLYQRQLHYPGSYYGGEALK